MEICRLCFKYNNILIPIFDSNLKAGDTSIQEMIFYCLTIMVSKSKGEPDKLCEQCFRQVINFFTFKKNCIAINTELNSFFKYGQFLDKNNHQMIEVSKRSPLFIDAVLPEISLSSCDSFQDKSLSPFLSPFVEKQQSKKEPSRSFQSLFLDKVKQPTKKETTEAKLSTVQPHTSATPIENTLDDSNNENGSVGKINTRIVKSHINDEKKSYKCEPCGKNFPSLIQKTIHLQNHKNDETENVLQFHYNIGDVITPSASELDPLNISESCEKRFPSLVQKTIRLQNQKNEEITIALHSNFSTGEAISQSVSEFDDSVRISEPCGKHFPSLIQNTINLQDSRNEENETILHFDTGKAITQSVSELNPLNLSEPRGKHFISLIQKDIHLQNHKNEETENVLHSHFDAGDTVTRSASQLNPLLVDNDIILLSDEPVKKNNCNPKRHQFSQLLSKVPTKTSSHSSKRRQSRQYKCELCDIAVAKFVHLLKHDIQAHRYLLQHRCAECNELFVTENRLEQHRTIVHKPFKCISCNKTFSSLKFKRLHQSLCVSNNILIEKPASFQPTARNNENEDKSMSSILNYCFGLTSRKEISKEDENGGTNNESGLAKNELDFSTIIEPSPVSSTNYINLPPALCVPDTNDDNPLGTKPSKQRRIYPCKICNDTFKTFPLLLKHDVRSHSDIMNETCNFCKQTFVSADRLNLHCSRQHKLRQCDVCKTSVKSKTHRILCSNKSTDDCHNASTDTEISNNIVKYSDKEAPKDDFKADTKISKRAVKCSSKKATKTIYKCDFCNRVFQKFVLLLNHDNEFHYDLLNIKCDECFRLFVSETRLMQHQQMFHRVKSEVCHICEKTFSSTKSLEVHQRLHSEKYKCEMCDFKTTAKIQLTNHKLLKHDKLPLNYKCGKCNKTFTQQSSLNRHMKSHFANKGRCIVCDVCSQLFRTISDLNDHKETHHHTKFFECSLCTLVCRSRSAILVHIKRHQPPNYACKVCERKFHLSNALLEHQLTHTGDKLFTCFGCGKQFSYKKTLIKHIKLNCIPI